MNKIHFRIKAKWLLAGFVLILILIVFLLVFLSIKLMSKTAPLLVKHDQLFHGNFCNISFSGINTAENNAVNPVILIEAEKLNQGTDNRFIFYFDKFDSDVYHLNVVRKTNGRIIYHYLLRQPGGSGEPVQILKFSGASVMEIGSLDFNGETIVIQPDYDDISLLFGPGGVAVVYNEQLGQADNEPACSGSQQLPTFPKLAE